MQIISKARYVKLSLFFTDRCDDTACPLLSILDCWMRSSKARCSQGGAHSLSELQGA